MCKKADDDFSEFLTDPILRSIAEYNRTHAFDDETPEQIAADDRWVEEMEAERKAKNAVMTKGYLWYNTEEQRYGVIDASDCWAIEGLHCGACMEILIDEDDDKWEPVRLEYNNSAHELSRGWYLVGHSSDDLDGLRVRMR